MSKNMYLLFALFLILALVILFGSHFFAYWSIIKFFQIVNAKIKLWLAIILFFLSVSFILSSILAHYSENVLSRGFYFGAGLWLGVGLNLILGFVGAWILFFIFQKTGIRFDSKVLGSSAIIFAILFSIYGVVNAYNPRIKNITVKLKNLPASWQGKKAVQISDVHLGHVLRQDFLAKVVERTNEVNPDIVFITGDLFDGMDGAMDLSAEPIDDLKAPVYFITGNHETYFGLDKVKSILAKTKVKYLNDELVNLNGLQLIGVSYPERTLSKDVAKVITGLKDLDKSKATILLYHSPTETDQISKTGVDLQLSGHTHRAQLWPLNFITYLVYHGYDYGLHQIGDMTLYTSAGTGDWGPTMRTSADPEITVITLENK